ncbi:MAG: hypothetical protein WD871_11995, partial [Xanthobacteraceae bacterium]
SREARPGLEDAAMERRKALRARRLLIRNPQVGRDRNARCAARRSIPSSSEGKIESLGRESRRENELGCLKIE